MELATWSNLEGFDSLGSQFREVLMPGGQSWPGRATLGTSQWNPIVDVLEIEDAIHLRVELPGIPADDVEIRVEKNVLTINGERQFDKENKQDRYHRIERQYGCFKRTFSLPSAIDEDKIKAEFKDGLLTVTIPKQEQAKVRQIKIS